MGKTIPTYLIDSDPEGTQYAFISNQISKCFNSAFGTQQKHCNKKARLFSQRQSNLSKT